MSFFDFLTCDTWNFETPKEWEESSLSQIFVDKLAIVSEGLTLIPWEVFMWSELCRTFLQYQTPLENDPFYLNSDTFSHGAVLPLLFKPASGGSHLFHSVKGSSCKQDAR